ncbi:MAG: PorT family protein [bacterium]|nr:PorT family protein [bacterium]
MKRNITFLFALIITTTPAFGQLQWGARAGLSLSTVENNTLYHQLHSTSESSTAGLPGLNAALMLKIPLSNRLSLITEAQYLQKGGRMQERFLLPNTGTQPVFEDFKTDYKVATIELPVLLHYELTDGSWKPGLFAGLSYGRILSHHLEGDQMYLPDQDQIFLLAADGTPFEEQASVPLRGEFEQQDWSLIAGLSLSRSIGQHEWVFDARYLHDFTDWRTEKVNGSSEAQLRSRALVVSVGVWW